MKIKDRRTDTIIADSGIVEAALVAQFVYVTLYAGYTLVLSIEEARRIGKTIEEYEKHTGKQ